MKRTVFGSDNRGNQIEGYLLGNNNGMEVMILSLGAVIQAIRVPDREGNITDVALGYDSPQEYLDNGCYFGALIGRNGNRIDNAAFDLNGIHYELEKNDGDNNLHSGGNGYHQRVFQLDSYDEQRNALTLSCEDEDMGQGFPGHMDLKVVYTLSEDNTLTMEYIADSDKDTIANFTNHSYFNLSGHGTGTAADQEVMIYDNGYTPVRAKGLIPTGVVESTLKTPMDFHEFTPIQARIEEDFDQLIYCGGYDHNYSIQGEGYRIMAEARSKETGILMKAYTDCPGMQFYAGNFIGSHKGKEGVVYEKRSGYCFESQYFPNAINCSAFASPVLRAGEVYRSRTAYQFLLME